MAKSGSVGMNLISDRPAFLNCKMAKKKQELRLFLLLITLLKRPFYTMPDSNDPNYTLSFDLLGVSEEWIMGGQRINDYEMLLENIKKWEINGKFPTYLQSFKYGMPPEGGFAMGLER